MYLEVAIYEAKVSTKKGLAEYNIATTPLKTKDINSTYPSFQMRYVTLFQLKGPNIYKLKQKSKVSFTMEITYLKLDGR